MNFLSQITLGFSSNHRPHPCLSRAVLLLSVILMLRQWHCPKTIYPVVPMTTIDRASTLLFSVLFASTVVLAFPNPSVPTDIFSLLSFSFPATIAD